MRMKGQYLLMNSNYVRFLIIMNIIGYGIPCIFKLKATLTNILFCLPHYIYFSPAYLHTLLIYAFCNVDDLSWYIYFKIGGLKVKIKRLRLDLMFKKTEKF